MDINSLKENEDFKENQELKVKKVQQEAKNLFAEFKKVNEELSNKINTKKAILSKQLIQEFKNYFESNGFEIKVNGKVISAIYKELEVVLTTEEGYMYNLKIEKERIYVEIEIREENEKRNIINWKHLIRHDYKDVDYNKPDEFFNSFKDIKIIEGLEIKLKENIAHYKNTIEKFNSIKYVFALYDSINESNTFRELFETHINVSH